VELQHQLDEMSQKNSVLVCANSMLVDECRRLRAGQQAVPSNGAAVSNLDAALLQGVKSLNSWWSPDA